MTDLLVAEFEDCCATLDPLLRQQVSRPGGSLSLSEADRLYLLKAARVALEAHFQRRVATERDFFHVPRALAENAAKVYVTLYRGDRILGCRSAHEASILASALKAVPRTVRDGRFSERASRTSLDSIRIAIDIVLAERELDIHEDRAALKQIHLGLDSIRIERDGQGAQYKADVAIGRGWSVERTMRRLCRKAGLDEFAFRDPDTKVWTARSFQFAEAFEDRFSAPRLMTRLRGRPLVLQVDVDRFALEQSLRLSALYLRRNTTPGGRLTYQYDLRTHVRQYRNSSVAVLRKLATTWTMIELGHFLASKPLLEAARRAIDRIVGQFLDDNKYIKIKDKVYLGCQAFLLAALTALDDPDFLPGIADRLTELIVDLEDRDGGFLAVRVLPNRDDGTDPKQIYYSGEGLMALALRARAANDVTLLGVHKRVLPFYETMFDEISPWMNMCAWHSKAYRNAFQMSGDLEFARFVMKMNDRLVATQRTGLNEDPDWAGSFGRNGRSYSTAVFLESLAEGLSVAAAVEDRDRMRTYGRALFLGMRYLLSCQWTGTRIFDVEQGRRALGGFETSVSDPTVRIDNMQHCSAAIMRFLEETSIGYRPAAGGTF